MPASVSRMRGRYPHPAAASPRSNLYSHHGPSSMARPHPCCQVRTRRPGCHPTASGFWRGLGLCVGVHPIHPTCRGEKYLAWLCERLIPWSLSAGGLVAKHSLVVEGLRSNVLVLLDRPVCREVGHRDLFSLVDIQCTAERALHGCQELCSRIAVSRSGIIAESRD